MRKLKVLVLTSSFPRSKDDWWAQFILNTYKYMPKNECEITVIAPHAPGAKLFEVIDGLNIMRFPYFFPFALEILTTGSGILHSSKKSILGKIQIIFFVVSEFLLLLWILFVKRIDIVHAHWVIPQGFLAIAAKFIFRVPVVVTVHGSDLFGLTRLNFLKSFSFKHCDICTVNSSATFLGVQALYKNTNIKIFPMGVDTKMFISGKNNAKIKYFLEDGPIVLAVGRLITCKGFEYLIDAMPIVLRSHPKAKLLIVGLGPEEHFLKRRAEEVGLKLGNNVSFTGSVSHKELALIYASCDVFVAPSVTDPETGETEGQGIAILEALSSGLPVVASNSGGIKDIIDGVSTGLLTKERDSKDLAQKISLLISKPIYGRKLAKTGGQIVRRKYNWDTISKNFLDIYTPLLSKYK